MLFFEISIKFIGLQRSFFVAFFIDFDQRLGENARQSTQLANKLPTVHSQSLTINTFDTQDQEKNVDHYSKRINYSSFVSRLNYKFRLKICLEDYDPFLGFECGNTLNSQHTASMGKQYIPLRLICLQVCKDKFILMTRLNNLAIFGPDPS